MSIKITIEKQRDSKITCPNCSEILTSKSYVEQSMDDLVKYECEHCCDVSYFKYGVSLVSVTPPDNNNNKTMMSYDINSHEYIDMCGWRAEHENTCVITNRGAIGGNYSVEFTDTSLGTIKRVNCACGEHHDITDYTWW